MVNTDRSKIAESCHKKLSLIGVFLLWKTGYPDYYITIMEMCGKKDRLVLWMLREQYYHEDMSSE